MTIPAPTSGPLCVLEFHQFQNLFGLEYHRARFCGEDASLASLRRQVLVPVGADWLNLWACRRTPTVRVGARRLWTVVEIDPAIGEDAPLAIIEGRHTVNAIGYIVTDREWGAFTYHVRLS